MSTLPLPPFSNATENILEAAWVSAAGSHKAGERDFLREIHATWGLWRLAWALNSDLYWQGISVSLTSIWIDHTPQCWFGGSGTVGWKKPSCELADLLVVAWDDHKMRSGRAILFQGKMARDPSHLIRSGASTKNELLLLEKSPAFLLSSQSSVRKGSHPAPYSPSGTSTYCLNHFGTNAATYQHCRFLQIRHPKAKRWQAPLSSWHAHWPASGETKPYARSLSEMVLRTPRALGEDFKRHAATRDWDALVNQLIDTTVSNARHGTAKGPAQTHALARFIQPASAASPGPLTISHCPANLIVSTAISAALGARNHELPFGDFDNGGNFFDLPEMESTNEPSGGMSILFITPYPHHIAAS